MLGDTIRLAPDEHDHAVWLILESTAGSEQKELVWLRKGFTEQHVLEAILATGWVTNEGEELRCCANPPWGTKLSAVIEELLGYFDAPGSPTKELLRIEAAVADYTGDAEFLQQIPLCAYAFLDVLLRGDLAEEARSADKIWDSSQVAIELDCLRNKRLQEFLSRYSPTEDATGRMAGSISTRRKNKSQDSRAS